MNKIDFCPELAMGMHPTSIVCWSRGTSIRLKVGKDGVKSISLTSNFTAEVLFDSGDALLIREVESATRGLKTRGPKNDIRIK